MKHIAILIQRKKEKRERQLLKVYPCLKFVSNNITINENENPGKAIKTETWKYSVGILKITAMGRDTADDDCENDCDSETYWNDSGPYSIQYSKLCKAFDKKHTHKRRHSFSDSDDLIFMDLKTYEEKYTDWDKYHIDTEICNYFEAICLNCKQTCIGSHSDD